MDWIFCEYEEFDAATNMAIDEELLAEHLSGKLPPVVRLYGFVPPAVTLGYAQKIDPQVIERIKARGFDAVHRPTGGRAVLHLDDLTYCFVGSEKGTGEYGFLPSSVALAYKQICQGLLQSIWSLGAEVELGETQAAYRHLSDCFLATTPADLHFKGKKVAGSAQLRRSGGVLQHGSIILQQDQEIMPQLLGACVADTDRHANLLEILDRHVSWSEFNHAFVQGFSKAFDVTFKRVPVRDLVAAALK